MRAWFLVALTVLFVGCGPKAKDKPTINAWIAVTGKSMLPTYPEVAMVEIEIGFPYEKLQVGDPVVFWDYKRGAKFTHHRIVEKQGPYFIVRGDNPETNPVVDKSFLTKDTYVAKGTGRHAQLVYAAKEEER